MSLLKAKSLADLLGFELTELAGAHVAGQIPVNAALINRLIAARLSASEGKVADVRIEPLDADAIVAHVTLRSRLVPPLAVHLQIQQQPVFPDLPVLVLRWSMRGFGGLVRLASPVLALFDVLPPGVRIDGDLIGVDLAAMLRAQGLGELLPHIVEVRFATKAGRVIVMLEGLERCVTALTPAARRVGQLVRHAYRRFILPPGEQMPSMIYRRLRH